MGWVTLEPPVYLSVLYANIHFSTFKSRPTSMVNKEKEKEEEKEEEEEIQKKKAAILKSNLQKYKRRWLRSEGKRRWGRLGL